MIWRYFNVLFWFKNTGEDDFLLLQLIQIMMETFFDLYNGSASFSVKGQIINILGFVHHTVSYLYYSVLPLDHESWHRRYVNEGVWLCSNKTLFTKAWRAGFGPWVIVVNLLSQV